MNPLNLRRCSVLRVRATNKPWRKSRAGGDAKPEAPGKTPSLQSPADCDINNHRQVNHMCDYQIG
jgi:hypothetical protein